MDPALFYLFDLACLALGLAPGPGNVLALGNGARHGMLRAFLAGTGRLAADNAVHWYAENSFPNARKTTTPATPTTVASPKASSGE